MDTITLLLFIAVIVALGMQTWFLLRKRNGEELPKNDAAMAMLQQQLSQVSQTLDAKLAESNRAMQEQFGQSFAVIKDVTQKLTELDSTNKQVVGFAQQLQSLENILKNPKQRGILGEYYLETVLKNVLPPQSFQMQYKFKNGEIVDAAVFVKDKIIPIDSKFGGILQMRQGQGLRFVELIHYDSSSLDPSEIFIRGKMTSIGQVAAGGNGKILANFREIPALSRSLVEGVIDDFTSAGINGVLHQLLDHAGGTFHYFTGGDAVRESLAEYPYVSHCPSVAQDYRPCAVRSMRSS